MENDGFWEVLRTRRFWKTFFVGIIVGVALLLSNAVKNSDHNPLLVKQMAYEIYMENPVNADFEKELMKQSQVSQFEELWRFHEGYRSSTLGHETVMWTWEQGARRRLSGDIKR